MSFLSGIETNLENLYKNAPELPDNGKKGIVNVMPWITLVLGILQLMSAWVLWDWGRKANKVITGVNDYARASGIDATVDKLGITYWASLLLIVVIAIIFLAAFNGLKTRSKKRGWDLLFIATLINLLYGLFYLFTDRGGIAGLFGALIGSAIGFYFLFQIKPYYNGHTIHHVKSQSKT